MKHRTAFSVLPFMACLLVPQFGSSLPWSDDMRDQDTVKPQESDVSVPKSSVPVDGGEALPVPKDLSEKVQARILAGATLENPVPVSEATIATGQVLYDTHCSVCHGANGAGDGLVGQKYTPPPINLTLPYIQMQPDGQIYYTITHGSVQMPYYRDSMTEEERWHVVNYLKNGFEE